MSARTTDYKPNPNKPDGQAEWKRLIELALLRGWAKHGCSGSVTERMYRGKGQAWGWGK